MEARLSENGYFAFVNIYGKLNTRQQTGGKVSFYHCQKGATIPNATTTNESITLFDISDKAFFTILLQRVKDEVDVKMREETKLNSEKVDSVKTRSLASIRSLIGA